MTTMNPDTRVAIVTASYDVEETDLPFGKRWGQQRITLTAEHLEVLRTGQLLALDVLDEYVVLVGLDKSDDREKRPKLSDKRYRRLREEDCP
jgi:hypothetical protein